MAVHGGSGVSHGVIERLRASRPDAKFLELVHRLDRETSGLLLIAKRRAALVHLHEQLRAHSTVKIYYAIVVGSFALRSKKIDLKLLKITDSRGERHVYADDRGIDASTIVTGLHRFENAYGQFTVVRAQLETGRTHQIRVHCAASGFPIVGDPKYGVFELNRKLEKLGARRMFLHAHSFQFGLPNDAEPIEIIAPLPGSFSQFSGFVLTS
jgi:23S rRNA pseudouridine955/2504/2580 synthase